MTHARILVVEDDRTTSQVLVRWLERKGFRAECAETGDQALHLLQAGDWDLVFLDFVLPDQDGLAVLRALRRTSEALPVIFMTAHGSVELAVEAMKAGVTDYITKPLNRETVLLRADNALRDASMRQEIQAMRSSLKARRGHAKVSAQSRAMQGVMERVDMVAESDGTTVLLLGESGVGKNLIAQEIHDRGARADAPFMSVLCTALPANLLESELFGHERGAFTDAKTARKGLVELADGGTVFLDELGELPLGLQAKLLQFLEDRAYRRVGGSTQRRVDVRVIAATNRDLAREVREGRFRADLFYRLNVIEIRIPALRERPEDILPLADRFIAMLNPRLGKQVSGLTEQAARMLCKFHWPGNVRELKNLLERAMILTRKTCLDVEDFPGIAEEAGERPAGADDIEQLGPEELNLLQHELALIRRALTLARGNQSKAARLLGISRNTLLYRIRKFNLEAFPYASKANLKVRALRRGAARSGDPV